MRDLARDVSPLDRLDSFRRLIEHRTAHHAGYPYNLDYDYTPLLPFLRYTLNNLGDPYVNGNYGIHTREFERETLQWFAELYEIDDAWGYVTSCGTEGNLYGLALAHERFPQAVLYYSKDTHYSVKKAARLFRMRERMIPSQPNGEIDYVELEAALRRQRRRPAVITVNLGTTLSGAVDRIDRVAEMVARLGLAAHLHCDGALGGLLLPYLEGAPRISFRNHPIDSIAVSGHKFVGSPVPCGVVLTRRSHVKEMETAIEYIGSTDTTIMGSRNGLAALFLWYAIQDRADAFAAEARTCVENARYLHDRLEQLGYHPLLNDFSTTVLFDRPPAQVCQTWQLACQGDRAHVVVMQNLRRERLDQFIQALA
ncbi:MAG TPA: histidine decarboxylase [Candidatus Limnocylindrales bacterium]|nr:histidine decarboxylase [Candidatus Limnocylindrales bacterium]